MFHVPVLVWTSLYDVHLVRGAMLHLGEYRSDGHGTVRICAFSDGVEPVYMYAYIYYMSVRVYGAAAVLTMNSAEMAAWGLEIGSFISFCNLWDNKMGDK